MVQQKYWIILIFKSVTALLVKDEVKSVPVCIFSMFRVSFNLSGQMNHHESSKD